MADRPIRIILDTNLWLSFLITKDYNRLDQLIISKRAVLIFSAELMEEFLEVASRPKFRKYFSVIDVENLLESMEDFCEYVEVHSDVSACRDAKDNFLLALALDGKADYLLTGDRDLLSLGSIGKTQIILIADYLDSLT